MKNMKSKRAAMEMSVGTIVTIVLLMSALVLGLILTKTIFNTSKSAMDLTEQQLTNEIGKAFGSDEAKLAIYPKSGRLTIKQEQEEAIGLGIRNLLTGTSGAQKFSYEVKVAQSTCGNENVLSWIKIGSKEEDISISVGDYYDTKIYFEIPTGAPLCTVKYRIEVRANRNNQWYAYDNIPFVITSKAK